MKIEIISDTVCPWCFIGKRRLEGALAERPEVKPEILWRPFQLNPDMPNKGADRKSYLESKFGGPEGAERIYTNVREAGASAGIAFDFEAIERTPNTIDSHRLIHWAGETGRQSEVVERLFAAYFLNGRDIGDSGVLRDVAGEAGLAADDIEAKLAGDEDRYTVLKDYIQAVQIGVTGVPFFIFNRKYAISGAQEPSMFHQVFDEIANEAESASPVTADTSSP